MATLNDNPTNPQFPPSKICTTCGRAIETPPPFGAPPPALAPGSRFAAAMAEYLILRREYQEADRQLGESMAELQSTAPAGRSVG
jgi:hypothetical protein